MFQTVRCTFILAGDPRAAAVLQAQKLADEKWAAEITSGNSDKIENIVDIAGESAKKTLGVSPSSRPATGTSVLTDDVEFTGQELGEQKIFGQAEQAQATGYFSSWLGPSKEQRRADAEFKKFEKEFKERSIDLPSLPPTYLPSAWAILSLMASLTFHALFFLMCRWLPGFKSATLFEPANAALTVGCCVLVVPPVNRGKPDIVPVTQSSSGALQIEFQRQKYFYVPPTHLSAEVRGQFPNGLLKLCSCPVDHPLSHYTSATGLRSEGDIQSATELWGKNHLAVHIPSFLELLKNQLLSPLSMFQVRLD